MFYYLDGLNPSPAALYSDTEIHSIIVPDLVYLDGLYLNELSFEDIDGRLLSCEASVVMSELIATQIYMDLKEMGCPDPWMESAEAAPSGQPFSNLNGLQQTQKQEDASVLDYGIRTEPRVPEFNQPSGSYNPFNSRTETSDREDDQINELWDPRPTLSNLAFLEQKIHQLKDLVHLIGSRRVQALGRPNGIVAQHQQLINADLTSIIVQLISAAGSLLPSVKNTDPYDGWLNPFCGNSDGGVQLQNGGDQLTEDLKGNTAEEQESKDEDDVEGENLPLGSYEILQIEREEILAPHRHFCVICGKGFKRDANLRMHMRGHGDEYKTPAALAKPTKESGSEPLLIKRYSCPYAGCKRNKDHTKFQPLKTILCVKNHYKRTHCDKSYTCSRCNSKKFSVLADLKTHEKHCGRDKWLCSCGTTFSRKDKLFGHIALFQGHAPALTLNEAKGAGGPSEHGESDDAMNTVPNVGLNFDEAAGCLSPLNFDACNFGRFHEFPRPPFDDSENLFSFLNDGSFSYASNDLQ